MDKIVRVRWKITCSFVHVCFPQQMSENSTEVKKSPTVEGWICKIHRNGDLCEIKMHRESCSAKKYILNFEIYRARNSRSFRQGLLWIEMQPYKLDAEEFTAIGCGDEWGQCDYGGRAKLFRWYCGRMFGDENGVFISNFMGWHREILHSHSSHWKIGFSLSRNISSLYSFFLKKDYITLNQETVN